MSRGKIAIIGDTHGTMWFLENKINEAKANGANTLIIAGDFGFIWNIHPDYNEELDYISNMGMEILFVDGNHENFELLNSLPIIERYNGKVGKVRDNIYHLQRGELYTIKGHNILTMGGAYSIDRDARIQGKSWWPEEIPSYKETDNFIDKLDKPIDYIITHTGPSIMIQILKMVIKNRDWHVIYDPTSTILDEIDDRNINYKKWFMGHYHVDYTYSNKQILMDKIEYI